MEKIQVCTGCSKEMHLSIEPGQIMANCPYCGKIQAVLTDADTIRECMAALKKDHLPPTPDSGKSGLSTALEACEAYNNTIPDGKYFDGGGT